MVMDEKTIQDCNGGIGISREEALGYVWVDRGLHIPSRSPRMANSRVVMY